MLPKFFAILSAVTQEGPCAAQLFRNIRTAILSAVTIRRSIYAAHTFRNLGTLPHSPCIAVRTGPMLPKMVRPWVPTLSVYVTHRVYAGQMSVELLTPFAYLVQCSKRVYFFLYFLYFLFFAHFPPFNIQEV